ncbi:SDR family NAD(P)-dependent oxidoreductase [Salinithrix halophila]|uniref:SDR family NAD(P)-dependent oxidoreductase n=1 Tax=Salinithrix halophila TaxID=1485204 RepID=A0ABV8JPP3_9BACL
MPLKGRTVLVTGGSGFIGSHLTEKLLDEGAEVRVFIRYNSMNTRGFIDTLPKEKQREITIITGDLRDPAAVSHAVKGVDVVFHLGALIAIPYSYKNPMEVIQTNVLGTTHIAQAVLQWDVPLLIHTSTSETYGTAQVIPMDESHPLQGQSPYSASKIGADKIIESFHCSYGMPAITLRPFNAYGPRQSMRAVIPTIINQALYQDEIRLGNLSPTRDFTFVEDTARAFIRAADSGKGVGETINVGSGTEISIGGIVEKVRRIVGRDIPVRVDTDRQRPDKSEVDRLVSDSTKAARVMEWKPSVSWDEGLKRTIDWIKNHPHLYRPEEYVL